DYFTTYEVDGDTIAISEAIGSTRMACPSEELAEQSQWYYGALTSASTWSVDAAGNLQLRDADGSLQVGYTPAG
ncbi:MAG: META domain-containing protein, partial [Chloroflexota bacterium]|nr:META domain-containing protein [Chloroflexota bacterium]